MRLLFVCLGNICRSPTAEGVMRHLLEAEGLADRVHVQSAGTGSWHIGAPPDRRSTAVALTRGITLSGAARQAIAEDFEEYDLLLAMDTENLDALRRLAPDPETGAKVRLLREFDPASAVAGDLDVPDPFFGGDHGFERVLDVVEAGCRGLLDELRADGRV